MKTFFSFILFMDLLDGKMSSTALLLSGLLFLACLFDAPSRSCIACAARDGEEEEDAASSEEDED